MRKKKCIASLLQWKSSAAEKADAAEKFLNEKRRKLHANYSTITTSGLESSDPHPPSLDIEFSSFKLFL